MNRADFQEISETRLQEAKVLLDAGFPDGAYYLAGYAVECALKACIAKRTQQHDFPEKDFVNASYTHKLNVLLELTDLKSDLLVDPILKANWDIVQDWTEKARYEKRIAEEAHALLAAIENQKGGLFQWIKQRW